MATPALNLAFRFDGKNVVAQQYAEAISGLMVTRVTNETRAAIRALVVHSIRAGIPVYDAARMIRSMVGMTAPQAMAAVHHREMLINSGLNIGRVDRLMERYIKRKIKERAETIARSEIITALNGGQQSAWGQAMETGHVPKTAHKRPIVTPDERLCFCAGTMIATPTGQRPIETIRKGDLVDTHIRARPVVATIASQTKSLIVSIVTSRGIALVTADHPYLAYRNGACKWVSAGSLKKGDLLCCSERPADNWGDANRFYIQLRDPYDIPTMTTEPSVFPGVPPLVSVPVIAVNFQSYSRIHQQEVNTISADTGFLNESNTAPFKLQANRFFEASFPGMFPVARNRTESPPRYIGRDDTECLAAVGAFYDHRRAPALFRTEISSPPLAIEALAASGAVSKATAYPATFERAHGVSVGNDDWYLERLGADRAYFGDGFGCVRCRVAASRAKSPEFAGSSFWQSEFLGAGFTDKQVSALFGFIGAGERAKSPLPFNEWLATSDTIHKNKSSVTVYSLEVKEANTFFAGGALVHNCPICADVQDQTVPVKEPFQLMTGPKMHPSFHPRCRCSMELVLL